MRTYGPISSITFRCKACDSSYHPKDKRRASFCSRECAYEWRSFAGRLKPAVFRLESKRCRVCERNYLAGANRPGYFCTDKCASAFWADYNRERLREAFVPVDFNCAECGVLHTTEYGSPRSRFCSNACMRRNLKRIGKQRRRAAARAGRVDLVDAIHVFERDGWRCHICGRETPRQRRGTNHRRAPELDHIIPLAKGGEHSYSNTACACRECNGRKSAKIFGQPSLFSAEMV